MATQRPQHLTRRQVQGRAFGQAATLLTVTTTVNQFGEPGSTETQQDILCDTSPPSRGDSEVRLLAEGGIAFGSMRKFHLVEDVRPVGYSADTEGDIIAYEGERFRVHSVERWGGFNAVLGVRIEGQ